MMFNPKVVLINAFVERLQQAYQLTFGQLEPHYPGILGWAGRMALECIAGSDALYHDVEHTVMVTFPCCVTTSATCAGSARMTTPGPMPQASPAKPRLSAQVLPTPP